MTSGRLLAERYEIGAPLGYGGMAEVHHVGVHPVASRACTLTTRACTLTTRPPREP